VPVAIGVIIAVVGVMGMIDDIERMKRVVMPGEVEIELGAGEWVVYGETTSTVDGRGYHTTSISLSCMMVDAASGEPMRIETPTGSTSYSIGGFKGQSMFELDLPRAGTYRLTCEGGGDAVLAFGRGIGGGLGLIFGGVFGGIIAAVVTLFLVRRKRKRAAAAS
jgi:hypothetical protein